MKWTLSLQRSSLEVIDINLGGGGTFTDGKPFLWPYFTLSTCFITFLTIWWPTSYHCPHNCSYFEYKLLWSMISSKSCTIICSPEPPGERVRLCLCEKLWSRTSQKGKDEIEERKCKNAESVKFLWERERCLTFALEPCRTEPTGLQRESW